MIMYKKGHDHGRVMHDLRHDLVIDLCMILQKILIETTGVPVKRAMLLKRKH